MRSSSAPKIESDGEQNESLLEGYTSDLERDVEPVTIFVDASPAPKVGFYYDMLRVLDVLNEKLYELKNGIVKSYSRKFHIYSTALIILAVMAITAPTAFLGYVLNLIRLDHDKLVTGMQTEIERLQADHALITNNIEELKGEAVSYRAKLFGYLKSFYESWWMLDKGVNCVGQTEQMTADQLDLTQGDTWLQKDYFCEYYRWFNNGKHKNGKARCIVIANAGCMETERHSDLTSALSETENKLSNEKAFLINTDELMYREKAYLESGLLGKAISDYPFLLIGASTAVSLGIVSLFITILVYRCRRDAYAEKSRTIYDVGNNMPEFVESQDTKTLMTRLGIQLAPNVSIKVLAAELSKAITQDEERWKRVIAFDSGRKDPNSSIYGLFNRDISRKIVEMAGLGPKYSQIS